MQVDNPIRHAKHVFRILLLLAATIVAIILGRSAFVPDTWGQYGWYRGANVAEQRDRPVRHGGDVSCQRCHEKQAAAHDDGAHISVRCEVCHAPVAQHAVGGQKIGAMPTHRDRNLCLRCHRRLTARPKDFPQIEPQQHVEDNGGEWGEAVCFDCHDPHSPS